MSTGATPSDAGVLRLTLYVGTGSAETARARANLQVALAQLDRPVELAVVDVMEDPGRAARDGVLLTPTLVRHDRTSHGVLIGNLSNREVLDDYLRDPE